MKRYIIIGALLVSAVTHAHANVGDTYEESCNRFGSKGVPDKKQHCIYWVRNHHTIFERFVRNECVYISYVPEPGYSYTVSDVWNEMLPYNRGRTQSWSQYFNDNNSLAAWTTNDDVIYCHLYSTGQVRIAYKWWLVDKGLLYYGTPNAQAPVEDGPSAGAPVEDGSKM
jgi:hypothetical protein